MKMRLIEMGLALCLGAAGLRTAWAGPLQRNQIPADAAWYLALDLDKLKTTQVGQHLMSLLDKPEAQEKLAAFQALFDFDPRKKLKSCALFSRGSTPQDAVLLLQGDFDQQRLVTLAKLGKGYQSSEHRTYTIHSWIDQNKKKAAGEVRTFGALHTSGVVLLGQKARRLGEALDVLDRVSGGLDKSRLAPPGGVAPEAAVLVGAASPAGVGQLPPHAAFLKNFKGLSLAAGEAQNSLAVELVFEAENADAARNLMAVGQGLLAWAAMQGDKNGGAKLLQGLTTTQKDSFVTLRLDLPSAQAIGMMKDSESRKSRRER